MAKTLSKIKTTKGSNFGQTINFLGVDVKFDRTGIAEVEPELANKLIAAYKGWIVDPEAVVEIKKSDAKNDSKQVEKLQIELDKTKEKTTLRESTIASLEKELKDWKEQLEVYKEKAETAEQSLADHKEVFTKIESDLKLEVSLLRKNVAELIEFCDQLEIPEAKYKGLSKDKLIELILAESK